MVFPYIIMNIYDNMYAPIEPVVKRADRSGTEWLSVPRVMLILRFCKRALGLALFLLICIGLTGCSEDNEAAIREQARKAKGAIPGSRTAQAQTQEEYFEITPGVRGAGLSSGIRPDQGKGYPGAKR
jgi:hypothetical protein